MIYAYTPSDFQQNTHSKWKSPQYKEWILTCRMPEYGTAFSILPTSLDNTSAAIKYKSHSDQAITEHTDWSGNNSIHWSGNNSTHWPGNNSILKAFEQYTIQPRVHC